ncbi:MAG: hypothetical protein DIU78_018615 [Pseudomonadota bacterium]|nr:MAG: hypothetical protein DIU78_09345 [Pseudomonadota bacterium]
MSRNCRALVLLVVAMAGTGCVQTEALRARLAALDAMVLEAERNGALHCAPRELAKARSQLAFAALELGQGSGPKARAHLDRAEPLARAALLLSPAGYCARLASPGSEPTAHGLGNAPDAGMARDAIGPASRTAR